MASDLREIKLIRMLFPLRHYPFLNWPRLLRQVSKEMKEDTLVRQSMHLWSRLRSTSCLIELPYCSNLLQLFYYRGIVHFWRQWQFPPPSENAAIPPVIIRWFLPSFPRLIAFRPELLLFTVARIIYLFSIPSITSFCIVVHWYRMKN